MAVEYEHGTGNRYRLGGCRCDACRAAQAKDSRDRRRLIAYGRWAGLIDSTGTIRRLRALAAVGWSFVYIAGRRGLDRRSVASVADLANGKYPKVRAATAREYALLYDELCTADGPSKRSRTWALKRGWDGPEAWTDETIDDPSAEPFAVEVFDEVAVNLAVQGKVTYGRLGSGAERVEAFQRLVSSGAGSGTIRHRLNISGYTLQRLIEQVAA